MAAQPWPDMASPARPEEATEEEYVRPEYVLICAAKLLLSLWECAFLVGLRIFHTSLASASIRVDLSHIFIGDTCTYVDRDDYPNAQNAM